MAYVAVEGLELEFVGEEARATSPRLLGEVQTPKTPHPGATSPPPPPGEPPSLLRNKRPHGLGEGGGAPVEVAAAAALASASRLAAAVEGSRRGRRHAAEPHSAVVPSAELGSSAGSSDSASDEDWCSCEGADDRQEEDLMADVAEPVSQPASRPVTPPGPPPAEMAPPPPAGPPPSLPMDRGELKRGADWELAGGLEGMVDVPEDTSKQQLGKKLRCSADVAMATFAGPVVVLQGLEESYARSPPSARWVWDRILQKDSRSPANAAALERRALLALDALTVGHAVPVARDADGT